MAGIWRRQSIQERRAMFRRLGEQSRGARARLGEHARAGRRHVRTLARDPEVRQAVLDVGALYGSYQVLKRLPDFRMRSLGVLRRKFPPGTAMHEKLLAMTAKEHELRSGDPEAWRKYLGSKYDQKLRRKVNGKWTLVDNPDAPSDPKILQLRKVGKEHLAAKRKLGLARRRKAIAKAKARRLRFPGHYKRLQARELEKAKTLKASLRERIGTKLHNAWRGTAMYGGAKDEIAPLRAARVRNWKRLGIYGALGVGILAGGALAYRRATQRTHA